MCKSKEEWSGESQNKRKQGQRTFYATAGLLASVALILFVAPPSARADAFFSDLGTSASYDQSLGFAVAGAHAYNGLNSLTQAGLFTSAITGSVTQIDLGVTYEGPTAYSFDASIWTENASNQPGTELGSWTDLIATGVFGTSSNSLVTISNISGVGLTAGDSYFLMLAPASPNGASFNVWNFAEGDDGLTLYSFDGGATWSSEGTGEPLGAVEILGTPVTAAPESGSTVLFLGVDLAALAGLEAVLRRKLVPVV